MLQKHWKDAAVPLHSCWQQPGDPILVITSINRAPTSEELIAAACLWFFWDPQALFAFLRGRLKCPSCKAEGLAQDGWSKLPRKIHGVSGLVLLFSRTLSCKKCGISLPPLPLLSLLSKNWKRNFDVPISSYRYTAISNDCDDIFVLKVKKMLLHPCWCDSEGCSGHSWKSADSRLSWLCTCGDWSYQHLDIDSRVITA